MKVYKKYGPAFLIVFLSIFFHANLFSQQIVDAPPIIWMDRGSFHPNPEVDSYPFISTKFKYPDPPNSTLNLQFDKFDQIISNPQYLIDTLYFHNFVQKFEKFKDYRRIFYYDEESRIVSVIAEELLDNQWTKHQETRINYNEKNRVSEINYHSINSPFIQSKISFYYDSLNYLQEEIHEERNETDSLWNLYSVTNYIMQKGKLSYYETYYYLDSECIIENYLLTGNQLINNSEYFAKDSMYFKRVYGFSTKNKITSLTIQEYKDSTWQLYNHENYFYNENEQIKEVESLYNFSKPALWLIEYLYDENRNLIAIISNRDTVNNDKKNLIIEGKRIYEHNQDSYLTKYISLIRKDDELTNREMITYERDENNNINSIKNYYWSRNEWTAHSETRIIYSAK